MTQLNSVGDFVAIIPMRAGSKGLPGKNVRMLAGAPLYMHAVQQGIRTVGRVLISTDISFIKPETLPQGCSLYKRPSELATDDALMASVIEHVILSAQLQGRVIVLLQVTSPLRTDEDIQSAISIYLSGEYDLVMSVVERDPNTLKYGTLDGDQFFGLRGSHYCFQNRQELPPLYGPNGAVYVFSASEFIASGGFPTKRIGVIKMPVKRSIDVDTEANFLEVEAQLTENQVLLHTSGN